MNTYQIFLRRTKQDYVAGSLGKSLILQGDKLEVCAGYITIKKKSLVVFSIGPG